MPHISPVMPPSPRANFLTPSSFREHREHRILQQEQEENKICVHMNGHIARFSFDHLKSQPSIFPQLVCDANIANTRDEQGLLQVNAPGEGASLPHIASYLRNKALPANLNALELSQISQTAQALHMPKLALEVNSLYSYREAARLAFATADTYPYKFIIQNLELATQLAVYNLAGEAQNQVEFCLHATRLIKPDDIANAALAQGCLKHANLLFALLMLRHQSPGAREHYLIAMQESPATCQFATGPVGFHLQQSGQKKAASIFLRAAQKHLLEKDDALVAQQIMVRHLAKKNFAKAAQAARRFIRIHPNNKPVSAILGIALQQQGNFEEARSTLSLALTFYEPFSIPAAAHTAMGLSLLQLGEAKLARQSFEIAHRIAPYASEPVMAMAQATQALGFYDIAEAWQRRLVNLLPQQADVYAQLGRMLYQNKRLHEAMECFEKADSLKPGCKEYLEVKVDIASAQKDCLRAIAEQYNARLDPADADDLSRLQKLYGYERPLVEPLKLDPRLKSTAALSATLTGPLLPSPALPSPITVVPRSPPAVRGWHYLSPSIPSEFSAYVDWSTGQSPALQSGFEASDASSNPQV